MKILRTAPTLLAAAAAAWLVAPTPLLGFSTIGTNLDLTQRDFRVLNNFADPEANDNQTPDAQFPGYQGAVMAIWKASVEWGSALHGTGDGDPSQPGGLGSGGANFDPTFQGLALDDTSDNIHLAVADNGSGLCGFVSVGVGGGWQITYCESILWDDGPGDPVSEAIDIQGVATHEYGHALGLGHTSVGGATMYPSISGTGVSARSIENDDINGIQFIYGAASPTKPVISAVALSAANLVTITGSSFSPTGNEVWFTQATAGGTGDPVKVTNVASTAGGTQISVTLPPLAGSGDVLVKNAGAGHSALSNAWPFDATGACGIALYGTGLGGSNIGFLQSFTTPSIGSAFTFELRDFNGSGTALVFLSTQSASTPGFGGTVLVDSASLVNTFPVTIVGGDGSTTVQIPGSPGLIGGTGPHTGNPRSVLGQAVPQLCGARL